MDDQSPFLVAPYAALASCYDQAGFSDYAREAVLRYINEAQGLNWAGRGVLDLGCGTGITSWLLSERGFRVTGVDASAEMLALAETNAPGEADDDEDIVTIALAPPSFVRQDIRMLESPMGSVDMVMATGGVLNELGSLRELQQTLARVAATLEAGRMFIFDVVTIQGLAHGLGTRDQLYYQDDTMLVMARHSFSYETLSNTVHYAIFKQQDGAWQRHEEIHVLRGFPTQGIVAMLERTGLETLALLDPEMRPFDPNHDDYGRAVFMARRV